MHILPDFLEVLGDIWIGSVEEEGIQTDDVLVGRNITKDLVLIVECEASL